MHGSPPMVATTPQMKRIKFSLPHKNRRSRQRQRRQLKLSHRFQTNDSFATNDPDHHPECSFMRFCREERPLDSQADSQVPWNRLHCFLEQFVWLGFDEVELTFFPEYLGQGESRGVEEVSPFRLGSFFATSHYHHRKVELRSHLVSVCNHVVPN